MKGKRKSLIHNSLGGQDKGNLIGIKPDILCSDYTILKNRRESL